MCATIASRMVSWPMCYFKLMVVAVFGRAYNPRGLLEVRQALENVNKVEDLLPIMKVRKTTEVGIFQGCFSSCYVFYVISALLGQS